ncbi:MAG: hypothetical protein J7M14_05285 [Planctomycetes bacterium]|nr:hypothetical protein [Planctomycetota bacterium]
MDVARTSHVDAYDGRAVILSRDGSLEASLRSNGAVRLRFVSVRSAYEAAAEILAGPAVAMIVDLRILSPRNLRLLEIARDLNVELLAVGALPLHMTADDLSGVRLLSRRDIIGALETALSKTTEGQREELDSRRTPPQAPGKPPDEIADGIPLLGDVPTGKWKVRLTPAKRAAAARDESATVENVLASIEVDEVLDHAGERPVQTVPAPAQAAQAQVSEPKAPQAPADGPAAKKQSKSAKKSARPRGKRRNRSGAKSQADQGDGLLTAKELAALLGDEP